MGLLLLSFSLFQNCYFNPVVNGFLNPLAEEDNNAAYLGILGLAPSSYGITGQLKSNGSAVVGAVVSVVSPQSELTSTTDSGGRFHVIGKPGPIELQVNHSGTIFKIEILIMPPTVSLVSIGNSSYTVSNLEAYTSTTNAPVYLDIANSIPYDGMYIDFTNIQAISGGFMFSFTEELEEPSDQFLWVAENFVVNPSITLNSPGLMGSAVSIMIDSGTITANTIYNLTLNSGIKSVSGKSLKPTNIQFRVGVLAN
ncbi:hypothetical protein JWG41_20105 [Leptospira sp. 201903075]|uniref:hypothetical protein n=1 Tax=Leptospira chreensis TaxID=2810035 RepID=UPI0019665899|nr:hypothetical protein [Leptospira chreensis]MBM9592418.1 hypothetical protein [Leptospira chreensis]MBM9592750.1 hypothetical protein [Leptospira chreensis]